MTNLNSTRGEYRIVDSSIDKLDDGQVAELWLGDEVHEKYEIDPKLEKQIAAWEKILREMLHIESNVKLSFYRVAALDRKKLEVALKSSIPEIAFERAKGVLLDLYKQKKKINN